MRFRIFFRFLIKCQEQRFKVQAINRHTSDLRHKLKQNPQLLLDSVLDVEIISLEDLWEYLLIILKIIINSPTGATIRTNFSLTIIGYPYLYIMRKYYVLLVCFLIQALTAESQSLIRYDVEVFQNGGLVANPFTGGLKAGQFSKIDLDNDGVKDLFVFDRNGAVVTTYLNKGGTGEIKYEYAPQYESIFPKPKTFGLLYDFNNDGIEDLFKDPSAGGIAGIEVWRGKRDANGLYFELVRNRDDYFNVLYFMAGNSPIQVYNAPIDLPGIRDVDKDGDTDILSFELDGSFLNYYRNYAVELGLGIDTFVMDYEELCFGGFMETMFSSEVILDDDSDGCADGLVGRPTGDGGLRHAGSTVTILDGDCDDDVDLILGDFLTPNLTYLENGGTLIDSWITGQDAEFPSYDTPARMEVFLASFYIDINNDGKRDLIVTPNQEDVGQNTSHVWLYLNEGEDCAPVFKLHQDDFLLDDMLHFNRQSHPIFLDYNQDGLKDILVGTGGIITDGISIENRFYLLENIGDNSNPVFSLVDDDYLGLSNLTDLIARISPEIADIDGDGDDDLFFGNTQGTLFFYENIAGPGNEYDFKAPNNFYNGIFVGQNSSPDLFDVNNDGLIDLAIGEKNSEFTYLENIGTPTDPQFDPDITAGNNTKDLGHIRDLLFFGNRNGSPAFFYSYNQIWMLQGNTNGEIRLFNNIKVSETDTFEMVNSNILPAHIGENVNADLSDINGDNQYEIVVGNERGGIHLFQTDIKVGQSVSTWETLNSQGVNIYPNPVRRYMYLEHNHGEGTMYIYRFDGQLVHSQSIQNENNFIDLGHLNSGMFALVIVTDQGKFVKKFVKI